MAMAIDERFAKLYFPGTDPIGKRVHFDIFNTTAEIVGIVGHIKQWGLESDEKDPVQAQCYFPIAQIPDAFLPLFDRGTRVVVRTGQSPLGAMGTHH